MYESRRSLLWVQRNIRRLLADRPWLLNRIRERGGAALLVLEYWRKYCGLEYRIRDWDRPLTSPETILREARYMRLTRETVTRESLSQFIRSGQAVETSLEEGEDDSTP